jgi:AcrR family transcriptional regulator
MIKKEYHHGNLKEEFLRIAFEFIQTDDIDKLTLKILSEKTNTSRSAIYRHFENKDALIATMIEKGFDRFDDAVAPVLLDKEKPLVDRFYLGGKHYIAFAKSEPNLYRLLFGYKYSHIREDIISIKSDNCQGFHALKKTIEEGQESGIVKKESAYNQAIIVWSSLHGLASLFINCFRDVSELDDTLYDEMFQSLLAGLLAKRVQLLTSLPFMGKLLKRD